MSTTELLSKKVLQSQMNQTLNMGKTNELKLYKRQRSFSQSQSEVNQTVNKIGNINDTKTKYRTSLSQLIIDMEPDDYAIGSEVFHPYPVNNYGSINSKSEDYRNNNPSGGKEVGVGGKVEKKGAGGVIMDESVRTRKRSYTLGMRKSIEDNLFPPLLPKTRKRSVVAEEEHEVLLHKKTTWRYLGIVFTLFSTVFSSLSALTVKLLEDDYHTFVICFWRFCTLFVVASSVLLFTRFCTNTVIWPRNRNEERFEHAKNILLLVIRGLLGCTGRVLYVYSITCMNLGDSMVIASSTPVVITFFAYFLIGEKCGVIPILVSFGTLAGVAVISRPPFLTGGESYDSELLIGTETGMAGMIMTTLVMIAMRKVRHIHHAVATLSFAFFGMIVTLALNQHYHSFVFPTGTRNILLILASGLTSFFGQTFLTLGLKFENAGPVALMKNFDVVFAFLWSYAFFGITPDFYSLVGGCIVIFFIVISTVRKWVDLLPDEHQLRSTLGFLLR